MYKLTVKLKQHTPLIHFQHEQHGATLRATELKPKLDRFLIDIFKKQKTDYSGYLIGNGTHEAMDYKVNIVCEGEIKVNSNIHRLFFGNMGDENLQNPKQTVFTNEPIRLVIQSFHEKLLSEIQLHIADFFANTNFGTRQSKGFGSFYLHEKDALYSNSDINLPYRFTVDLRHKVGIETDTMFDYINIFYKALRSGINEKDRNGNSTFYMKPFIFQYAKNNGWQWEKKTIKETFFSRDTTSQQTKYPKSDALHFTAAKYLVRDCFGLSSAESWRSYRATITKKSDTVERFKSPVFFKPIRKGTTFWVYFKADKMDTEFMKADFTIESTNSKQKLPLKPAPSFDFATFLGYIFDKKLFSISNHIENQFKGHKYYKILEDIFRTV